MGYHKDDNMMCYPCNAFEGTIWLNEREGP